MLSDALKEVRDYVLINNGDADQDEKIIETLDDIAKKTELDSRIDLQAYHNYFSMLKMELHQKGLESESLSKGKKGAKKVRQGKDWMPVERRIMWMYLNAAQDIEGLKYTKAEQNIAEVLGKSKSGIRFKYYEIKNKVGEGQSLEEVLSASRKPRERKGTVVSIDTEQKKKRGRKPKKVEQTAKTSTIAEQANVVEEVKTKTPAFVEANEPQETQTTKTSSEVVEPVSGTETSTKSDSTQEVLSKNYQNEVVTYKHSPKKEKTLFQTLSGIMNNFRVIAQNEESIESKEEFSNFLIGLETLTGMAAASAHSDKHFKEMQSKIESLEEDLKIERKESDALIKFYKDEVDSLKEKYSKQFEQKTKDLEDAFKTFKNTQLHFFNQDDFGKMDDIENFEKRVQVQLERMEDVISKQVNLMNELNARNTLKFIADKNGLVTTAN